MNIREEIAKIKTEGYNELNAAARLCQDLILYGIANSGMKENVTVKGGVVMRNLSKDARRATQDLDIDFIRYSISDEKIIAFIQKIDIVSDVNIEVKIPIQELNHQDYRGKRVYVIISDVYGNELESKIDIGVHKDFDVMQEECGFDICFQEDSASLLMNSKEQIIVEKLKSFFRFGSRSTRYKDVFDIYYLSHSVDVAKLRTYIKKYIFDDTSLQAGTFEEVITRIDTLFCSSHFVEQVKRSKKNWLDVSVEEVMKKDIEFIHSMQL